MKNYIVALGKENVLELQWIPPGEFWMGSQQDEDGHEECEAPYHLVRITRGFWMGKYPVTQQQWQAIMGSNPSKYIDPRQPVKMVSRPEKSALKEAERTRNELAMLGITNQRLILNGIFKTNDPSDTVARALEENGRLALSTMSKGLSQIAVTEVSLKPFGLVEIERLRCLLDNSRMTNTDIRSFAADTATYDTTAEHISTLIDELSCQGRGVVMIMGKGGVGKTTLASAIAVELAHRGHRVHLSTTDPAAHVDVTLADTIEGLSVGRIDPEAEVNGYKEEVMRTAGSSLDEQGRKLLEEDLRSPCTEEIAVFRAFARKVDEGKDGFVVLDTAPTGHTLLLLDAAESYHREVTRTMSDIPQSVRELLPRLRDRDFTKILLVTLPEATPVHEAAQLQKDLKRAGIEPFGWIINQSMAPLDITDPILMSRKSSETRFINEVKTVHAKRVALVPWMQTESVAECIAGLKGKENKRNERF